MESTKSVANLEESKDFSKNITKTKPKDSTQTVTNKVSKIDLNQFDTENDFEVESRNAQNEEHGSDSDSESDSEESTNHPRKPQLPTRDDLMVLPHLHKHDLVKKKIYEKPSTWI
jgi:hypothetical protein